MEGGDQEENNGKMAFIAQPNPVTGKQDWVVVNNDEDDYDYVQEIARSGYGDMLHDVDRNQKYYAAIKLAVKMMKAKGQEVKVLDIGTGTGLLSMMAATAGADTVTACEAFQPMAKCANQVLKTNGFADKIKLVPKRSTEVLLGEDLKERANLLVTELFDTELIGEGAIPSYTDAHRRLMQDDCVAVPSTGVVYIQAVESQMLRQWNTLFPVNLSNGTSLLIPPQFRQCSGAPSLHDLQVDQLEGEITLLSQPVEVFRFDFSRKEALKPREDVLCKLKALKDGSVDAFVMWWDLDMEPTGNVVLSCGPCWTLPAGETIPWRDHWMQAVYYPSCPMPIQEGSEFDVYASHDDYSLWFDTKPTDSHRPVCTCGLHVTVSRTRLAQMNDQQRNDKLVSVLHSHADSSKTCLVISDGSLLPLIAANCGYKKVYYLDNNSSSQRLIRKLCQHNNLENKISFLASDLDKLTDAHFDGQKIDVVIAEPFFLGVHLPWQHIYFWYALTKLKPFLSHTVTVLPQSMTIKAAAVQFKDLHKIRSPVGICEGFDITEFDKLVLSSSDTVDPDLEPHPVWEYPCDRLSDVGDVMTLEFSKSPYDMTSSQTKSKMNCIRSGEVNGFVVWTQFSFDSDITINGGLITQSNTDIPHQKCWETTCKQGVHFLPQPKQWEPGDTITMETTFNPDNGDFSFKFL